MFLRPTAVQRLRTFLFDHDPIPAWSSSSDVREHLYALLHARRDDEAFWCSLRQLAGELQADLRRGRADGLPARDAEVFSDHEIETMLRELQAALRSNGGAEAARWLPAVRSPAMLACLAVLGAAMSACTQSGSPPPAPVISADPGRAAAADAAVDVTSDTLVELFRDGSPDDVAAALEAMVSGPADAGAEAAEAAARKPVGTQNVYRPPVRPKPVPRYKGITF